MAKESLSQPVAVRSVQMLPGVTLAPMAEELGAPAMTPAAVPTSTTTVATAANRRIFRSPPTCRRGTGQSRPPL